ncbi:vesicle-associated membrane protein 2-like [Erpetoichthys calabaricus]|uniref:vesicle-associated membrane protein 2-like n=1 Tax=Erpetoichthys calabaricus TaxID=27687 RepID=UPI00223486F7|nr:vesicle-associated membrane protein 2-like [Erpetoichthys calabaricus]
MSATGLTQAPPIAPPDTGMWVQSNHGQMDEVAAVMQVNLEKVVNQDMMVSVVDAQTASTQDGTFQIAVSGENMKQKHFCVNYKMIIVLGMICTIVLIIIITYFCI